jgi:hypothetical protein
MRDLMQQFRVIRILSPISLSPSPYLLQRRADRLPVWSTRGFGQTVTVLRLLIFRRIPLPADVAQVTKVNKPREAVSHHQVLMVHY